MSADLIARAEAALEGVTEGPWVASPGDRYYFVGATNVEAPSSRRFVALDLHRPNAQFIAAARTLVPALVAEVEKWRAAAVYAHDDNGALQSMTWQRDELQSQVAVIAEAYAEYEEALKQRKHGAVAAEIVLCAARQVTARSYADNEYGEGCRGFDESTDADYAGGAR